MLVDSLIQQFDPVVREYFDFSAVDVHLVEPTTDPRVFEMFGWDLKRLADDTMYWWVAGWAAMTHQANKGTYAILSEKIWNGHYKGQSLERMAWIFRNIPAHIRRADVGFNWYSWVAPEKYSLEQKEAYLAYCAEHQLSHAKFGQYVKGEVNVDEPLDNNRDPRIDDLQMEIDQMRAKLHRQAEKSETIQLQFEQLQNEVNEIFSEIQVVFEWLVETQAPETIILTLERVRDKIAKKL